MTDCIAVLRQHNISSRCLDPIISPRESALRAAIDAACDELERLRSLIVDLRANASLLSSALRDRVMYEDMS